jgi:transcriptional regulator with XRE-family HTH domain
MSLSEHKSGRSRDKIDTPLFRFFEMYGYTDSYIAEITGYQRKTISNIIRDPLKMKLEFLLLLSTSLDVDIEYLLNICLGCEDVGIGE